MKTRNYFTLAALLIVLVVASLVIGQSRGTLEGADGQAEDVIMEIAPDYKPWFESIWEPPSGEIESGLFAVQAAIGGIVIGYVIGVMKGAKRHN